MAMAKQVALMYGHIDFVYVAAATVWHYEAIPWKDLLYKRSPAYYRRKIAGWIFYI